jgi:adenylyl-sulfate kinase
VKLVFIDAEYTGQHAHTTLVSVALVTLDGDELYVTLDDYDERQVTPWLREHVLSVIDPKSRVSSAEGYRRISEWVDRYAGGERVHLVSAGLGSDLLLFFELWKHGFASGRQFHALHDLPAYLSHAQHFDLNTLLFACGHDPDANREALVPGHVNGHRHDALHDARVVRECFLRLLPHPAMRQFPAGALTKPALQVSAGVVWQDWNIPREERERRNGHCAATIWLTGLSGAGKTTIARDVERRLFDRGCRTILLDGDQLRHGLSGDLGFSHAERTENIRRAGEVARLFFEQGSLVLCAFVSPYRQDRERVRALFPEGRFMEVFVKATLETCRARDPKGLYARAGAGTLTQFTGLSAPYEEPSSPDLILDTEQLTASQAAHRILEQLQSSGLIAAEGVA